MSRTWDQQQARRDKQDYFHAMVNGHDRIALAIERHWNLEGYPPELVSLGLQAAMEGRDAVQEVEQHIEKLSQEGPQ